MSDKIDQQKMVDVITELTDVLEGCYPSVANNQPRLDRIENALKNARVIIQAFSAVNQGTPLMVGYQFIIKGKLHWGTCCVDWGLIQNDDDIAQLSEVIRDAVIKNHGDVDLQFAITSFQRFEV